MDEMATWDEMVAKAVAWLLAHPGEGTIHALPAIARTPAERAFMRYLVTASLQQDERRAFEVEVMHELANHRAD